MKQAWFQVAHYGSSPADLSPDGWQQVTLPHQWSLEGIDTETGWYRLEFPDNTGRHWAEVRADYYAEAWFGNTYQGSHEGYFEPWLLEIPPGQDLLLKVAAPKEPVGESWPHHKQQIKGVFCHHNCRPGAGTARGQEMGTGGLWAEVRYFRTGLAALLDIGWRTVRTDGGWKLWLGLEIDLRSGQREADPLYQVPARASYTSPRRERIQLILKPANFDGQSLTTEREIELVPGRRVYPLIWDLPEMPRWEVWERGHPHLFELQVLFAEQSSSTLLGFRTLAQEDDWLVLNDMRNFLRGTNIIPTQWLASYTWEDALRDVRLLKEAHLNAVRVHGHLTHPYFYQACDREGVLVWQDFPLVGGYAADETFAQEAVRQAQAMVRHYGRHVSIYQWCAHQEPNHNRRSLDPLLAAALRHADPYRLVKEASDFREHAYPGWDWGHIHDFQALPGAPLPSEFGAQALPAAHLLREMLGEAAWPPDWEVWAYHDFQPDQAFRVAKIHMGDSLESFVENSQAYQARLIRFAVEAYRRAMGRVTGYFHYMFVEPWKAITWAVLDVNREPKQGFFALKEASAPVLFSLVRYRENLETGLVPLAEAWVVNDLLRPLEVRCRLLLEGPREDIELIELYEFIPPQAAQRVFHIGEFRQNCVLDERLNRMQQVLHSLQPGTYTLAGEIWEEETLLARSEVTVEYLQPTVPPEVQA